MLLVSTTRSKALEMGAVEVLIVWENLDINRYVLKNSVTGEKVVLIVWENLDINRYVLKNSVTGEKVVKNLNKEQETEQKNFHDAVTPAELEVLEKMSLLEWLANEYKRFGCSLEFVTNKSQEGSQFCRGFGGIGGILRYQLDLRSLDELSDEEINEDSE
ncbi:hypothetical protein HPP92_012861 [Vanilla planifolia]|uniref:eRF1 domain-containing protein n=1 Tax=Vanilla planifolia TaxID=51239 RepID=A0A835R0V4_VANPL|nr:hypothetical protein HPP92_012861 [Vanilla planifolia]